MAEPAGAASVNDEFDIMEFEPESIVTPPAKDPKTTPCCANPAFGVQFLLVLHMKEPTNVPQRPLPPLPQTQEHIDNFLKKQVTTSLST